MENKSKDFETKIQQKYGYANYAAHFRGLYGISGVFGYALLALSACFSAAFFAQYLDFFGENSIYAGFFLSCVVAFFIGYLVEKASVYYHWQGLAEPLVTTLAVGLVVLNIYADYEGAPELGKRSMGSPPADQKTASIRDTYLPQIDAIDAEIDQIEAREFHWCGVHNKAHKCEHANFYIHPKNDRVHVAKIEDLKAQKKDLLASMDKQLSDAGAMHKSSYDEYSSTLKKRQNGLRLGTLICTTVYLLLAFWRLKYGVRMLTEKRPETPKTATETPISSPQTAIVDTPKTPSVSENNEVEKAWEILKAENEDLREELRARNEHSEKK